MGPRVLNQNYCMRVRSDSAESSSRAMGGAAGSDDCGMVPNSLSSASGVGSGGSGGGRMFVLCTDNTRQLSALGLKLLVSGSL